MNYLLLIAPRAEEQLDALDHSVYNSVEKKIDALRENPRPAGCRKLTGHDGWRMRAGDYRIIYEIDDVRKTVVVLRVGHRKDIYR